MVRPEDIYYRKIVLRSRSHPEDASLEFKVPPGVEFPHPALASYEVLEDVYVTHDGRTGPWAEVSESGVQESSGGPVPGSQPVDGAKR